MVDSTRLGDVVDECAAGSAELVVEADAGGEAEEALEDALAQAGEGAGAVAFQGEQVFAGPEDRFDSLPDRCEVRASTGFVFAAGADDRGVELVDSLSELAAGVALVAEERFAAVALTELEQFETDLALIALGRGELERARRAVGCEQCVQPETPEEAGMRGAVSVVGGLGERGTLHRLTASAALDRGRVDQEQIVPVAGALAGEHAEQPLDRVRQTAPALEVGRLGRDHREQVAQPLAGHLE